MGSVEAARKNPMFKHGFASEGKKGKTYIAWIHMKTRCFNPRDVDYRHYGGRGITVCEKWKESFVAFLADMGESPPGKSIDRIDPNGNYEPGNCRWATQSEQIRNTRRNRYLTLNGKTQLMCEWTKELCLADGTIAYRLDKAKWSLERALTTRSLYAKP